MSKFQSPEFRAAIYGIFAAVAVVAAVTGALSDAVIQALLGVVSAIIAAMAYVNTPTAKRVARQEAKGDG